MYSSVGRWLQIDPLAETMGSWSPYNYVYNNPIAYIDPFGLSPYTYNWTTKQYEDEDGNNVDWQTVQGSIEESAEGKVEATVVNTAGVSTRKLTSILGHASAIFEREGFGADLFQYNVLSAEEGEQVGSTDGLFLAIIESSNRGRRPGLSELASNGRTRAWGGGGYQSYLNLTNLIDPYDRTKSFSSYTAGYYMAHEWLHQLAYKADLAVNGVSPTSGAALKPHFQQPLNLNTRGTTDGLKSAILQSPGNSAERILDVHWYLIRRYLDQKR